VRIFEKHPFLEVPISVIASDLAKFINPGFFEINPVNQVGFFTKEQVKAGLQRHTQH
jgi:hypothetical protein